MPARKVGQDLELTNSLKEISRSSKKSYACVGGETANTKDEEEKMLINTHFQITLITGSDLHCFDRNMPLMLSSLKETRLRLSRDPTDL